MKMETFVNQSKEVFIEGKDTTVSINVWSNLEGANIMVHGKGLDIRMAGSFRWEELDMIAAAITVARTA